MNEKNTLVSLFFISCIVIVAAYLFKHKSNPDKKTRLSNLQRMLHLPKKTTFLHKDYNHIVSTHHKQALREKARSFTSTSNAIHLLVPICG